MAPGECCGGTGLSLWLLSSEVGEVQLGSMTEAWWIAPFYLQHMQEARGLNENHEIGIRPLSLAAALAACSAQELSSHLLANWFCSPHSASTALLLFTMASGVMRLPATRVPHAKWECRRPVKFKFGSKGKKHACSIWNYFFFTL